MADPIEVVREFCDAMVTRDAEALRGFLADDVVYQNTGMLAKAGIDAVLADLAGQFAMFPESYQYRMVNVAAAGEVVLTERVDVIADFDGNHHGVPVMGTFVVDDGKIRRWTDYFDTGLIGKMLGGEDYTGLVPANRKMRLRVDKQRCQGHGRCYTLAPELLEPDTSGHALVHSELDNLAALSRAERALGNCPEYALSLEVQAAESPSCDEVRAR